MMSVVKTLPPLSQTQTSFAPVRSSRWRFLLLSLLVSLSIGWNVSILLTAPVSLVWVWLFSFLPYIMACVLVLVTKPAQGWRRWIELGLILVGAFVLRVILLPLPPVLSHDSWRYLWDAQVTLHGYSPYVYVPDDPIFLSLRDVLYQNSAFRTVPTIYPPGAQAIFLLSYLVAPRNLFVLKGIFVGFDLVTCGVLAFWLNRKDLDMSRCIWYAWCPLPILEFAIQGHLDAATVTLTVLAVLCAQAHWRGSRVLTGFLIALATLTKLYPLLLLFVVIRRRDWALLATCIATIILAYVPYLILGHGQILGFFARYASEHTPNAGMVQLVVIWIGAQISLKRTLVQTLVYGCDLILVLGVSCKVLLLRWQERISLETGTLALIGAIFAASSHIFPWYTATFLPWITLLIGPLWIRQQGLSRSALAVISVWYFTCGTILGYMYDWSWSIYYGIVYDVTLLGLGIALVMGIMSERSNKSKRSLVRWFVVGLSRFIPAKHGGEKM